MTRKDRDFITLRFRKQLDDDLKEAVKNLEDGTLSNLVRDGLRLMLGMRTTRRIEVRETLLSIPANNGNSDPARENEQPTEFPNSPPPSNVGKPFIANQKKNGKG